MTYEMLSLSRSNDDILYTGGKSDTNAAQILQGVYLTDDTNITPRNEGRIQHGLSLTVNSIPNDEHATTLRHRVETIEPGSLPKHAP